MFIKLTRAGGRTYAQLVESYRDEQGKPRQRTLASLGRVDESNGQVDALLGALLRAKGRPASEAAAPQVQFESALALGDVWALSELWRELGFNSLADIFRRARGARQATCRLTMQPEAVYPGRARAPQRRPRAPG